MLTTWEEMVEEQLANTQGWLQSLKVNFSQKTLICWVGVRFCWWDISIVSILVVLPIWFIGRSSK